MSSSSLGSSENDEISYGQSDSEIENDSRDEAESESESSSGNESSDDAESSSSSSSVDSEIEPSSDQESRSSSSSSSSEEPSEQRHVHNGNTTNSSQSASESDQSLEEEVPAAPIQSEESSSPSTSSQEPDQESEEDDSSSSSSDSLNSDSPVGYPRPAPPPNPRHIQFDFDDEDDEDSSIPYLEPERPVSPDYAAIVQQYEDNQLMQEIAWHDTVIERECCICYDNEKPVLTDDQGNWLSVTEFSGQIPDNILFLGPCRRHLVCKECVVQVVGNTDYPFLSSERIRVPCLKSGSPCVNVVGAPYYFNDAEIAKLLPESMYQQYLAEVERFSLPGYELIRCPSCNSLIPYPLEEQNRSWFGRCIVQCTQNIRCHVRFCYHCQRIVNEKYCSTCSGQDGYKHPKAFNPFFYKPNRQPQDFAILWRNDQLTLELCLKQLQEIVQQTDFVEDGTSGNPVFAMRCFVCLQGFIKSQDCNGMAHCGVERCYVCGYCMPGKHATLPGSHWGVPPAGCPRFDHSSYWKEVTKGAWKCIPQKCFSHERGECQVKSHRLGLRRLHAERRRIQLKRAFDSLPESLQQQIRETVASGDASFANLKQELDKQDLDKLLRNKN